MEQTLRERFTSFLLDCQALKFGAFTLKSGRKSPYFINAGSFNNGDVISQLGCFYADRIMRAVDEGVLPATIDTVFGPAYKGIPLAVATASALHSSYGKTVGYTFDRKEIKDHGDGGLMVGTPIEDGMNVLLVDDVMTAGTAVREVVPKLMQVGNVNIVGLVLCVDRMERSSTSGLSAVQAVSEEFGFPVLSIATIRQIFDAASLLRHADGSLLIDDDLAIRIEAYLALYGVAER